MHRMAIMALALALSPAAHAHKGTYPHLGIKGSATVVDGNHLRIENKLIRLALMDAPTDQWCEGCGEKAREALEWFVKDKEVWCHQIALTNEAVEIDGAAYSMCRVLEEGKKITSTVQFTTRSVNWYMVWSGWAYGFHWFDFVGTLGPAIAKDGEKAREKGKGMWRHDVQIPDDALARTRNRALIPSGAETLRGEAAVVDGERLRIGNTTVQLAGVAALDDKWCKGEKNHECAHEALTFLENLTSNRQLRCEPVEPPSTSTELKEVFCTEDELPGEEVCDRRQCWINWELVANGHALARRSWADVLDDKRHPMAADLARAEERAIKEKEGLWQDEVDLEAIKQEVEDRFAPLHNGSNTVTGYAETGKVHRVHVNGKEIYLYGMLTPRPEWCIGYENRNCGKEAQEAYKELVSGKELTCTWQPSMNWMIPIPMGICRPAQGGESINRTLIRMGHTMPMRPASVIGTDRIFVDWVSAYKEAKRERRGRWQGRVTVPSRKEPY